MFARLKNLHPLFLTILLFPLLSWIYYQRVGTFGFGDEWNNFIPAFFMFKGRILFSEIFHNHQPIPVFISYFIQGIFSPQTLYELISQHRGFVILWGLFFNFLIILRFKWRGIGAVFVYEATKYYVFGHLFLAEALLVYPLIYLFGLTWDVLEKKSVTKLELITASISSFLIIFLREPFMPVAVVLFLIMLIHSKNPKKERPALLIFAILCIGIVFLISKGFFAYFHQVYLYNLIVILPNQLSSQSFPGETLVRSIFYPLYIVLEDGKWHYFRYLTAYLSIGFLIFIIINIIKHHKYKLSLFVIGVLALSNLRSTPPDVIFHEAFHNAPWYGIFIFSVFSLAKSFYHSSKYLFNKYLMFIFIGGILFLSVYKDSFIWEKVDKTYDFTVNYAHYYTQGEAIRILSQQNDTLFADLWDYLIHFQANLDSPYKYAIYIFSMRGYPIYDIERDRMFENNPPTFYYTLCPKGVHPPYIPEIIKSDYKELLRDNIPSCIFVKREKAAKITDQKLNDIAQFKYSLTK